MKKYEIFNTVFAVLLIVFVIISVFTISYGTLSLIPLAYIVIYKKTKYYNWFVFFEGAMIIGVIALVIMGELKPEKDIFALVGVVFLSIIFILFGVFMPDHLTPGTDLNKLNKKNS